jgi:hypothetical protein
VRLQQIFPRILAAEYDPPDASAPCLHLLRSLLCSDPTRRADINAIMSHPWCVRWYLARAIAWLVSRPVVSAYARTALSGRRAARVLRLAKLLRWRFGDFNELQVDESVKADATGPSDVV